MNFSASRVMLNGISKRYAPISRSNSFVKCTGNIRRLFSFEYLELIYPSQKYY